MHEFHNHRQSSWTAFACFCVLNIYSRHFHIDNEREKNHFHRLISTPLECHWSHCRIIDGYHWPHIDTLATLEDLFFAIIFISSFPLFSSPVTVQPFVDAISTDIYTNEAVKRKIVPTLETRWMKKAHTQIKTRNEICFRYLSMFVIPFVCITEASSIIIDGEKSQIKSVYMLLENVLAGKSDWSEGKKSKAKTNAPIQRNKQQTNASKFTKYADFLPFWICMCVFLFRVFASPFFRIIIIILFFCSVV